MGNCIWSEIGRRKTARLEMIGRKGNVDENEKYWY